MRSSAARRIRCSTPSSIDTSRIRSRSFLSAARLPHSHGCCGASRGPAGRHIWRRRLSATRPTRCSTPAPPGARGCSGPSATCGWHGTGSRSSIRCSQCCCSWALPQRSGGARPPSPQSHCCCARRIWPPAPYSASGRCSRKGGLQRRVATSLIAARSSRRSATPSSGDRCTGPAIGSIWIAFVWLRSARRRGARARASRRS